MDLEHLLYGHTDIVLEDANVASEMGEVPKRHVPVSYTHLDSDEEYVDYICYQEDFETDDELIREVAEFAGCANKCKTDAETAEFLKYQFGVIPIQNADIPALKMCIRDRCYIIKT